MRSWVYVNLGDYMPSKTFVKFGYWCALGLASFAFSANAAETPRRVRLVKFVSEGYPPLKNKVSSLDVGVLEKKDGENVVCEILDPRPKTKAASTRWAPADLYSNAQSPKEFATAGARQGEKDIFWVGDDNNRNGGTDSYQLTLGPDPVLTNSMDFEDKLATKNGFSYRFRFTRKGIHFETIVRVEAKALNGNCTAYAYHCDRLEGDQCAAGAWKNFRRATVVVDVKGALQDSFKPPTSDKERNDISALRLELSEVDAQGYPKGEPYEKVVAKK